MFVINIFILLPLKFTMSELFHTSVDYKQLRKCGLSGAVVCAVQMSFMFEKIFFFMYLFEILEFWFNLCQFKCTTIHF